MNCIPSCHPHESPLTYACSNASNTSHSNPSYYSPTTGEVSEQVDSHVSSLTPGVHPPPSLQELASLSAVNNLPIHQAQVSLVAEKMMIKEHPLYPLLAVLLRHCETGTTRPSSPPSMDLFHDDLLDFINRMVSSTATAIGHRQRRGPHHHRRSSLTTTTTTTTNNNANNGGGDTLSPSDNNNNVAECSGEEEEIEEGDCSGVIDVPLEIFKSDPELNDLLMLAVKVLRIHIQELHKVNELSKDFCSRYITSLKTKFSADLLRFQDSEPSSPMESEVTFPFPANSYQGCFPSGSAEYPGYNIRGILGCRGVNSSGSCEYPSVVSFGDGPGNPESPDATYAPSYLNDLKMASQFGPGGGHYFHNRMSVALDGIEASGGAKTKRGVLPKRATQVMKQWLFQHLVHPYPTEDEKRQIASQTNLTLLQVNNWFINARRRILQPMLDSSGPYSFGRSGSTDGWGRRSKNGEQQSINKKKKAATSRPSNNRFWPASLAAAAALLPSSSGPPLSPPSAHHGAAKIPSVMTTSASSSSASTTTWSTTTATTTCSPNGVINPLMRGVSGALHDSDNGDDVPTTIRGGNDLDAVEFIRQQRSRKMSAYSGADAETAKYAAVVAGYGGSMSVVGGQDFGGLRRFASYGYPDAGVTVPNATAASKLDGSPQFTYESRNSNNISANHYQSFLQQGLKPDEYSAWPQFLDDRQQTANQQPQLHHRAGFSHALHNYATPQQPSRPEDHAYASGSGTAPSTSSGWSHGMTTDVGGWSATFPSPLPPAYPTQATFQQQQQQQSNVNGNNSAREPQAL